MFEQYIASLNSCRKCASIKPTREFAKWRIFAESEFQKPPTPLITLGFRVLADASKLTTPATLYCLNRCRQRSPGSHAASGFFHAIFQSENKKMHFAFFGV
jgi:hypothetical protein